jgi:hypothetical protein
MPTSYKILGQASSTAASSTVTVNLVTDPVLDNISASLN